MGRRESLVGFETGKLDSGVKHSQEDKASDDTAADALETNDSSDNYGPRPPKSEDAARLRKIYEQAHEGRKRQRKANFQALLTSFGLVAYVAVSGFLFLRYATPRSKRPQQVGGGSDYGLHDGYPVRHDNWYIRDNPNPPVLTMDQLFACESERREGDRVGIESFTDCDGEAIGCFFAIRTSECLERNQRDGRVYFEKKELLDVDSSQAPPLCS
ncbi:hypothetical protein TGGT1_237230 [Toxoplasma gondii GT1]|uniref:Transmembrane protein n=2 Tax=Toxoplasma gondii TaxID=5811 RepID=S7UQ33_TOXGG|nr:hypothetical protein TGGT1_237230 [Toxoplasma gondii GT1]KAF4640147.1 hypothetical protein TGRH88_040720 [Toxoplasma gondii]